MRKWPGGAPPRASFRHGRQGDGRQQLSSAVAGGTTAGRVGGCGRPGRGSPTRGVPEPRPRVASQAGGEEGGREALGVQDWPCFAENTQLPGAQAQSPPSSSVLVAWTRLSFPGPARPCAGRPRHQDHGLHLTLSRTQPGQAPSPLPDTDEPSWGARSRKMGSSGRNWGRGAREGKRRERDVPSEPRLS